MRTLTLTFVMISFLVSTGFAQEEPIPPKRSKAVKIGAFAGFTPGLLMMDVKPINDFLKAGGGAPLSEKGIFMYGGSGAAYIMVVPNLRVGGVGMSGSIKSTSLVGTLRRDVQLTAGFGGVTIEYVFPLGERSDISVGTTLGGGGIDLLLRRSNGGNVTWSDEQRLFGASLNDSANTPSNISRKLSGSFYVLVPSVNVEYAILGWLGVRLGVSYVGMVGPSWKIDDNYELLNVPSNINGNGVMINAGVFVGTF